MQIRNQFDFHLSKRQQAQCSVLLLLGVFQIAKFARKKLRERKMARIGAQKIQQRNQQINEQKMRLEQCTLSNDQKEKILNMNISQLQQLLYDRQLSVKQLLLLYIERTLQIALKLNLITEINFDEAIELAEQQDRQIANDREIIRKHELYGIPVSIKDMYLQKGFDSTFGVVCRCFKPSQIDGIQVTHIKKAGGICFVRSNIPQLGMTFESTNNIFGRALNPWNLSRATGGSSGGEAGLLAARCSVIGVGSDIGGSIRIPAAFCGVYGLKPGIGRQTEVGEGLMEGGASGLVNIRPSKGPLARCVDDLEIMTRVLFKKEYHDSCEEKDFYWNPMELRPLEEKKLRIGYIKQFKQWIPPNCMIRAVREACEAIEQTHEIVAFELDDDFCKELVSVFPKYVAAEGGFRSFEDNLKGEKIIKEYELLESGSRIPKWLVKYIFTPILRLFGQKTLAYILSNCNGTDVYGMLCDSGKQKNLNYKFLRSMQQQQIDAIILPGFGLPAIKHGYSKELTFAAMYTWIWNTMDVPVGSMPITVVKEGQDQKIEGHEKTFDFIYYKMNESMKNSQGLPVNVQIVSFPYQEEVCLKVMKDIENGVKFNSKHPYPY